MTLKSRIQYLEQALDVNVLEWLEHDLRMPTERMSRCTLFWEASNASKMDQGGQPMAWQKSVEALVSGPAGVDSVTLPGWDSQIPHKR